MYTMKEACQKINMTYETLKYYCNQDLVPNVKRDKNNYRIFDDKDIAWLEGLQCLRKAGMSIKDMKQYMKYCLVGVDTIPQRQEMLNNTKKVLQAKVLELEESLDYLDQKQVFYTNILNGEIPYTSNLIDID